MTMPSNATYIPHSNLTEYNWFSESLRLFPQISVGPETILSVLKRASLAISDRDPEARCVILGGYMRLSEQMAKADLVDIFVDDVTKVPFVRTTTLGEAVLWQGTSQPFSCAKLIIDEEGNLQCQDPEPTTEELL